MRRVGSYMSGLESVATVDRTDRNENARLQDWDLTDSMIDGHMDDAPSFSNRFADLLKFTDRHRDVSLVFESQDLWIKEKRQGQNFCRE